MLKYDILCTDIPLILESQNISASVKSWLRAIQLLAGDRLILFSKASTQAAGHTHSPAQWVSQPLYSRLRRPWREVDHSPPLVAIHLHDHLWFDVLRRNNYTFNFTSVSWKEKETISGTFLQFLNLKKMYVDFTKCIRRQLNLTVHLLETRSRHLSFLVTKYKNSHTFVTRWRIC